MTSEEHQIMELTIEPYISNELYGDSTQKYVITDDQESLRAAIVRFQPEIVIHLASFLTSLDDYDTLNKLLDVNIIFLCRLLDTLKDVDLNLFINTGTSAEYYKGDNNFNPAYLYAATKTAARFFLDYYSKVYDFKSITVVPYTIYGGKDSQRKIIDTIYESLGNEAPVDLSPGEQILDFIHIEDVTDFYVYLITNHEKIKNHANFHLGTGIGTSLRQLTEMMEKVTGKKANINWGGKPYRPLDVMYAVAKNERLDWQPHIFLEKGINLYIDSK